jgi:hypothetical protein
MARFRTIKPDFFFDSALARCSCAARLVYIALWCHADRLGRLRDDRVELAAKVFPYAQADFVPALLELLHDRFVVAYESDGIGVILIPNFAKHQRPHHTEHPSALPDPPPDVLIGEMALAGAEPSHSDGPPSIPIPIPIPIPFPFPPYPETSGGLRRTPEDSGGFPSSGPAAAPAPPQPQPGPSPALAAPVAVQAALAPPVAAPAPAQPSPATGWERERDANLARRAKGVSKAQGPARFTAPTIEEVRDEITRRGLSISAEKFHAHYEANEWVQAGGQKIKKWKAALTTWSLNEPNLRPLSPRAGTFVIPQRAAAFPPSAKALETAELEAEADLCRRNRDADLRKHADAEKLDELIAQGLKEKYGDGEA